MYARTHHWLLLVLLLAAFQTGCRVGPDYTCPQTPVPDVWHQQLQHGHYQNAAEVQQWWMVFNDPLLNDLITTAGEQNLDLYAAFHRIRQAQAVSDIAFSPRLAWLDVNGAFNHSKQSENALGLGGVPLFFLRPRDVWSLGFDTSWEADLFGRITRQIESAERSEMASVEAYRDIMVTLYAEVARNYVLARTLQARLDFAHRNVTIQTEALELAMARVQGGVSPVLDQHQAEANLAGTESEIPPLNAQLQQTMNRIAVLLGEYPGAVHDIIMPAAAIPQIPEPLPIQLPCDVVRQRPDIRQAERLYASRVADIGVAVSDMYPRFAINGSFDLQAQNLSDLLDEDSFAYSVGPSFTWAIFHAGQVMANIDGRTSAAEEAFAMYQQTVLNAAEEVENAIVAFNTEQERRDALQRAVAAAELSLERVLDLYRSGRTNFQNVLDTQRTLFTAQNQLAASQGQVVLNLISIYQAMGGGWDPAHHCTDRGVRLHCPAYRAPLYEFTPRGFEARSDSAAPPAADLPAADLPAAELPAAELPGAELPEDVPSGEAVESPSDAPLPPATDLPGVADPATVPPTGPQP